MSATVGGWSLDARWSASPLSTRCRPWPVVFDATFFTPLINGPLIAVLTA
jgi:hypothetical protein